MLRYRCIMISGHAIACECAAQCRRFFLTISATRVVGSSLMAFALMFRSEQQQRRDIKNNKSPYKHHTCCGWKNHHIAVFLEF